MTRQQNKQSRKQKQSRNKQSRQKKQQRGGFIRDNVPQFSEYCGTNPLYEVLPNPETCTSCQTGGKRSNRKLKRSKKQQRGGFIRDNVPQFSEYCGTNPLYEVLPNPETCTSCQTGGKRSNRKLKRSKNNNFGFKLSLR